MADEKLATKSRKLAVGSDTLVLDVEAVRHWRLQRGFTRDSLAKQKAELDGQLQSISYAQIRRIEDNGRCGPHTARLLAALLNVEISKLAVRDRQHLPCGLPREVSTDFVGRSEELDKVLGILRSDSSVRIAASVEGLPGIGKTELALQVCAHCERERTFRIFWIDAENPDLTAVWADIIAPHLGVDVLGADAPDPRKRATQAIQTIEALAEPVLIVLDNVSDWTPVRPGPRPSRPHIRWLVTTRVADIGNREFQHVPIAALDRRASGELMTRIAPAIESQPGFEDLLDELGGYTISVELAAAFLHRFPDVDPATYLAELRAGKAAALEAEVESRSFYGKGIEQALHLLWARLPERARRMWQLAACFGQGAATPALSDACGLQRRDRAALRDYHVIQLDAKGGSWSMHRLVRAYGRQSDNLVMLREAQQAFVRGCAKQAENMDDAAGFEIYNPDRSHYEAALELLRFGVQVETESRLRLLSGVGVALQSLGDLTRARVLLQEALAMSQTELAGNLEYAARCQIDLGVVNQALGNFDVATAQLRKALETNLTVFGQKHAQVAACRAHLGWSLISSGDYKGAKEQLEKAVEHGVLTLGSDHPSCARYRGRLGWILHQLGEFEQAQSLSEMAVESALQAFGDQHPAVARVRSNLAMILYDLSEPEAARDLLEQALASNLATFGKDHPRTARLQASLALVLADLGDAGRAKRLGEDALLADLRNLPHGHPHVEASRSNYGLVLQALGDPEIARDLLEQAIPKLVGSIGLVHPYVSLCRSNLAVLQQRLGHPEQARDLLKEVIACVEEALGAQHFAAARDRSRLAHVLLELQDMPQAQREIFIALSIVKKLPRRWSGRASVVGLAEQILGTRPPEFD